MKALPVRLIYGEGYEPCSADDATHVTLNIPGPTGRLTLPVIQSGKREGTGCWTWNGSTDKPTLRPSVKTQSWRGWVCHTWINDGCAQFLTDSTHELSGQTVPLIEIGETDMKLIALCGAAGAGKDTMADMLPARKLAFADTLYREVAAAWGIEQHVLRCRETKETPSRRFALIHCSSEANDFIEFAWNREIDPSGYGKNSPRQILQWWGDYRRAQDPDYFVRKVYYDLCIYGGPAVITDVRFPNEAAMVRQLGGQIWQIKRPGYEAGGTGHASDTDGSEFEPDEILWNQNTLEELRAKVLKYWEGV